MFNFSSFPHIYIYGFFSRKIKHWIFNKTPDFFWKENINFSRFIFALHHAIIYKRFPFKATVDWNIKILVRNNSDRSNENEIIERERELIIVKFIYLFCAVMDLMNIFFLTVTFKTLGEFESIVLLDWSGGFVDVDDVIVVVVVVVVVSELSFDLNDVSGAFNEGNMSSRANFSMSTSMPFILLLLYESLPRSSFRFAMDDVFDDELFDSTLKNFF